MRSIIMKSAWAIFRMSDVSFSEALVLAWRKAKQGLKAYILKVNKLVKSKGLGYDTVYFNELNFVNISVQRSVYNNDGAQAYYDGKTFNND